MKQLAMFQYSVVPGEKAILEAKISGNVIAQASAPMVQTGPHTWECTVGTQNIVCPVLATFPDNTPGSQVNFIIDGEINGNRGDGPFSVCTINRVTAKKDPDIQLFTK